jgi:hypothetical protein
MANQYIKKESTVVANIDKGANEELSSSNRLELDNGIKASRTAKYKRKQGS